MVIKNQAGFQKASNWYKGNLHSHTVNSDGKLTPDKSVKLFKEHGYHFLCLSEHDLFTDYTHKYNTDEFIILPGLEASAILYEEKEMLNRLKVHHIHGILGTKEMQEKAKDQLFYHREMLNPRLFFGSWDGAAVAQELVDELKSRGCITIYNHPIWSRVREEEFIHTQGICGVEIFNYNTVNESGTGYDTTFWDVILREGKQVHAVASDDNHNEGMFPDVCGGYIVVKAESLTHDNIINAMLAGNYYSSAGPDIYDWGVKDGVAYVVCSPVNRINFICGNNINYGGTVMCNDVEETISRAEFKLAGNETYLRVECADKYGKTAWTNAIFLLENKGCGGFEAKYEIVSEISINAEHP